MKYEPHTRVSSPIKLDLKDKKILKHLEDNSRQSYSQIAKKTALSKDSVRYRIKQLEEKGVIQEYKVVVDMKKLGYRAYHLFITLNNPEPELEKEYIEKLKSFPFVRAVIKFNGDYDFEVAIIAKDINTLDNNLSELLSSMNKYIKKRELLIVVKGLVGRTLPKNFLDLEIKNKPKKHKQIKIEDKDLEILKAMQREANIPTYLIAKKTKLTPDIVSYRLKKMEEGGFIIKYTPAINYYALSYQVYAILLSIDSFYDKTENKLKSFLEKDENVLWAVKTIGRYNTMIYICTEKANQLHETLNHLRTNFDVKNYKTLIAYKEYKYTYFPNLFLME